MRYLLLLLSVLSLSSCSSDGPSTNYDLLTNRWYYESYTIAGTTVPYDGHESCGKDYIELLEGGAAFHVDVMDCEPIVSQGSWTREQNNLILSYDGEEPMSAKITKLTESKLQVKLTVPEMDLGQITITFNRIP
jgi:hypothetical protein